MRSAFLSALLALAAVRGASAQDAYGAKGIYPVYETSGQWVIFDKKPLRRDDDPLVVGGRFLVVGTEGAQVFEIKRTSGTYGGACKGHTRVKLKAALLVGTRKAVGRPLVGIHVPASFTLKGSKAVYRRLKNEVNETTYQTLGPLLRDAGIAEAKAGHYKFKADDPMATVFPQDPSPGSVQTKLDFGASLPVAGLGRPLFLVEETEISGATRRCARLVTADRLVGECAEMPRALMAETEQLQFVSYDPSGAGTPLVLALTKTTPMWGDERWGFVLRSAGPRLFLSDAMDIRCREGF
jgi:hypothetical protein